MRIGKKILPPLLLACLTLSGCSFLLERSYSVVEPYTNRYWDSSAEDTLRAESYQDLVNSLLMLVEQRASEGVIRCYEEVNSYPQAQRARTEVLRETTLGSYLLEDLSFSYESGAAYSTMTYHMRYRKDTEEIGGIMTLSDSQSLVDLLRLTVREDRDILTARFAYDTPREEVTAAVESLWQELCLGEAEPAAVFPGSAEDPNLLEETEETPEAASPEPEADESQENPEEPENVEDAESPAEADADTQPDSADAVSPENAGSELESGIPQEELEPASAPQEAIEPYFPPCPWTVQFYPDKEMAEIVEILLNED